MDRTLIQDTEYQQEQAEMVISYMSLRKAVGVIGILLPIILIVGNSFYYGAIDVQHAISAYYHTFMGDVFVGVICLISAILLTYRGKDLDYIWLRLAAILALIVAFFPTRPENTVQDIIDHATTQCAEQRTCEHIYQGLNWGIHTAECQLPAHFSHTMIEKIHFIAAVLFFIILAYVILCLFTKSEHSKEAIRTIHLQKKKRNRIYYICGTVIIVALLAGLVYFLMAGKETTQDEWVNQWNPIFWIESICLWAFGVAWLVKGQAVLADKSN